VRLLGGFAFCTTGRTERLSLSLWNRIDLVPHRCASEVRVFRERLPRVVTGAIQIGHECADNDETVKLGRFHGLHGSRRNLLVLHRQSQVVDLPLLYARSSKFLKRSTETWKQKLALFGAPGKRRKKKEIQEMSYRRTLFHQRRASTSLPRRQSGGGCSGGGRLLKFNVCWDAAVCAVSAGGFFSVGKAFRKRRRPVLSA